MDTTAWSLLRGQMHALRDAGWDVGVACSDGPKLPRLRAAGFATHAVPISRDTRIVQHLRAVILLRNIIRDGHYDVVHVHTPVASLVGRLAAHWAGVPLIVYTAHGFYFHENMKPGPRRLHIGLERFFARFTDFLFTQSAEDAESAIREKIMPANSVEAIGNGVHLADFADVADDRTASWASRLSLSPSSVVIGIVGRLVQEKGYEEFFAAAAILAALHPTVRFLVVGDVVEGDRDPFKQHLMDRLELDNALREAVRFTGLVEDIPAIVSLMDIFVLPSYREGMPRSIIEAMAAGKPVVASDIRGCREEVIEGVTGFLVPAGDVAALVDRLNLLIGDPGLRIQFGRAGRARAFEHFDEHMVAGRIITTIGRLLHDRSQMANGT